MEAAPSPDAIRELWLGVGLDPARAEEHAAATVCVRRDADGTLTGASAPVAQPVQPLGPLWVHRAVLAQPGPADRRALFAATFEALADRAVPGGALGLCVLQSPAEVAESPVLALGDPHTIHAGQTADGRRLLVAWFPGARLGGGGADAPPPGVRAQTEPYRIEPVDHLTEAAAEALVTLWTTAAGQDEAEARRRLDDVVLVGVGETGELAGECSATLGVHGQLGVPVWQLRVYVVKRFRGGDLARTLLHRAFELLRTEARRGGAAGVAVEVENPGLAAHLDQAVWPTTGLTFVGTTPKGSHLRVRYFAEATLSRPTRGR